MSKKAVIILSGGLDSTVSLYTVKNEGIEIVGVLSFDYGQKHKKELEYAKKTCELLQLNHRIIDLQCLNPLLESSLTRQNLDIPEGNYKEESMKQTVVPNRNMIMISIAAGWAISLKADYVVIGVHQGDHFIYPDCRSIFINQLNKAIEICDWHMVRLLTPVINLDKTTIVKLGIEEKVPFENTWTCYKGKELACGKCGSCQERLEAFKNNNIKDPISYEN